MGVSLETYRTYGSVEAVQWGCRTSAYGMDCPEPLASSLYRVEAD